MQMGKDNQLVLVGCIHRDPGGYERLLALLEHQQPDRLSVEISPYSIRFRKKHQKELFRKFATAKGTLSAREKKHPALCLINEALKIPYEWRAAKDYSTSHDIPCLPIDVSWIARRHLALYAKNLLSKENLEMLCAEEGIDLEAQILRKYAHARRVIDLPDRYGFFYSRYFKDSLELIRETILAKRLRSLFRRGGRVLHIGGWIHMIQHDGFESLAALLRDLEPEKVLLNSPPAEKDSSA
jgi:hypothetical protein